MAFTASSFKAMRLVFCLFTVIPTSRALVEMRFRTSSAAVSLPASVTMSSANARSDIFWAGSLDRARL